MYCQTLGCASWFYARYERAYALRTGADSVLGPEVSVPVAALARGVSKPGGLTQRC